MHKYRVVQEAICECKFEQFNYQPYSPDLASSDKYLFRYLKSDLRGKRFQKKREKKCIEVKGDYIEK